MGVTINNESTTTVEVHGLRMDSSLSHWVGGGLKCILLVPNLRPRFCNVSSWRNNQIKLTHYDETKKRAHDSQIVRAKENPDQMDSEIWFTLF